MACVDIGDRWRLDTSLLIEFFLGLYDWLHIPIPIWIQIEGFAGTIRLRLQFIPEPPLIRNVRTADSLLGP
jgi:Ca2+-dependent lipid-binding protein